MRLIDAAQEGVLQLRRREAELAGRIGELERSEAGPEAVWGLYTELDKVRRRITVLVMPRGGVVLSVSDVKDARAG
jgi:hypothetical protein